MMRLIRVELTRLRWRRAVLALVGLAILLPALIGLSRVWDTRPPSPERQEAIAAQVERDSQRKRVQKQLDECLADPVGWGVESGDDPVATCEDWILPQPEWYGPPVLDLAAEHEGSALGVIVVLGLLAVLVGTTFAGHDWASGSMSNQLLFESRRGRVWAAKAVAVTATMLVVSAAVVTTWWLTLYAVARGRGLEVPDGLLRDGLEQGLRGAVVVAGAALVGYALTMLFRSTVVTLGVVFVVSLASGLLIATLGLDGGQRWTPNTNLAAVLQDGTTYWVNPPVECDAPRVPAGIDCSGEAHLSLAQGAGYLGVLVLGIGAGSVGSHRRRDVP